MFSSSPSILNTGYLRLLEHLRDMAFLLTTEGVIVGANQPLCRFTNTLPDVFIGGSLDLLCDRFPKLEENLTRAFRHPLPLHAIRSDGQLRRVQMEGSQITPFLQLFVLSDHTDELRLEEERIQFHRAVEICPDLICIMDAGGGIIYCNPAHKSVLGRDPRSMLGTAVFDYLHPLDLGVFWEILPRFPQTQSSLELPLRLVGADGETVFLQCIVSGFTNSDGRTIVVLVGHDDTKRHRLEKALVKSQKMEGIGRLARGIAHDFNNLLQLILGSVQCLDNEPDIPENICQWHRTIHTAAERGRVLVEQLQAFSKRDFGVRYPQSIKSVFEGLIELVRPLITGNITFESDLLSPKSVVKIDAGQIQQVLVNLVINACEAIPKGEGSIKLRAQQVLRKHGDFVEVSIQDNGHGISEEHLNKIFEPFFSTKIQQQGTGLGLAVAYGIIEAHGGSIEVSSEKGRGSIFSVYLPLAPPGTVPVVQATPEQVYGNDELILIVDDESMQRIILKKQLEFLGYDVLDAHGGEHALDLYEDYMEEINCVLLDVVMPKIDGLETLKGLQKLNPDVAVILTTGLGRDERVMAMMERGVLERIAKPFKIEMLSAAVRRALDAFNKTPG